MSKEQNSNYKRLSRMKGKDLSYFVSGFVDGEGAFSVSITKQPYQHLKKGWKWILNPAFQVYQHEDHLWFLEFLKDKVFKTGRIHRKSSPYSVFTYSVENRVVLYEKIIPFFSKYRLGVKDDDFQKFSQVIKKIHAKEHLTEKGFKNIVDLVFEMNKHGKQRKYSKEYIFETLPEQFKIKESSETIRQN